MSKYKEKCVFYSKEPNETPYCEYEDKYNEKGCEECKHFITARMFKKPPDEKRIFFGQIPGDTRIYLWDGVGAAAVYKGSMTELRKVEVKAHKEEGPAGPDTAEWITLDEIVEQVDTPIITVITDGPLEGEIYEYGNYGDYWIKKGEHVGYA